ncbi:MAG: alanine--tRNA ligase [Clostridiales bacterium]|nr:alanine--tRNA ligase [Clostridiales bacterium]MDY5753890.1 alanine--tRNA ligase [Eubacteriales bacterium]
MKNITTEGLKEMYLRFFTEKGHTVISSASLIPENDPTVLFTTAGMHPLVPYLLGQKHPEGTRLTNVQKCVRTGDIDEVGDPSHLTFFEMLGNWSLGDYFKKEAITWSFEFLTDEKWLGIPKEKLFFTVFAGDEDAPRDTEAYELWRSVGVEEDHIFFLDKKHNWWGPAGVTGPCGPDTEMFYDSGKPKCCPECNPSCSCGKYLEIWNNVFMQYNKTAEGKYEPLVQCNVDTGMGLERTVGVLQGVKSVYEIDSFAPIIKRIGELCGKDYYNTDEESVRGFRILADHIRTATFMIGDERGILPSNVDQGYILRRLIRRAIRWAMRIGVPDGSLSQVASVVIDTFCGFYRELDAKRSFILEQISLEEERFQRTIRQGIREFDKLMRKFDYVDCEKIIDGKSAFRLYDTFGFPIEFTVEMAAERGIPVDVEGFHKAFEAHQKKSQEGAEGRFKGGLADNSEKTTRLHTATHLLQAALRKVLGDEVAQKGSNITVERLRFDFSFPRKLTPEELKQVEDLVNEYIRADYEITCEEMTVDEARAQGAIGLFGDRYGERVKVYTMGTASKEICGGPHANRTGELVHFTIKKEEASSAGVRRIKAVIEG